MDDIEIIRTLRHCRAAGYCVPAVKEFCAEHDFDWRLFRKGVSASVLKSHNLNEFNNVIARAKSEVPDGV